MPKPLKKARRQPSDPNLAAADMVARSLEKHEAPSPTPDFSEQLSAYMADLGRKGGLVGGKRRLVTMTFDQRSAIGQRGAEIRWRHAKGVKQPSPQRKNGKANED